MSCNGCNKSLGKKAYKIQCMGTCQKWFHEKCTGLNENILNKVKARKRTWVCEACSKIPYEEESEDESDQDENILSSESEEETNEKKPKKKKSPKKNCRGKITLEDLMEKLESIMVENREYHKRLDKYESEMKSVKKQMNELKEENAKLNREINILSQTKKLQEQEKLENNVILQGIPIEESTKEGLNKCVTKIADKLKINLTSTDFSVQKIGKRNLKVKFNEKEKKDELMKAKKNTTLKLNMIGFQEDNNIYINHDMTQENQKLFKEARDLKKTSGYKYVWFSNGTVNLRKSETSNIIKILSSDVLQNLSISKN